MEKQILSQWIQKAKSAINKRRQKGQILTIALIVSTVIMVFAIGLISISTIEYSSSNSSYRKTQSLGLAEAGMENAIRQLNLNTSYTGTTSPTTMENGEYEISVATNGSTRIVTTTGYIPNKANYKYKKTVKTTLIVSSEIISFHYAVQIGNEGIEMDANSTINGNVYSNGNITGSSHSTIDGDAYAVGTISSPYPTVDPPHTKHAGSAPSTMPSLDYSYWENQANINNDPNTGDLTVSSNQNMGPKKIVGNLTINGGSTLTLTGPIWVTGNFTMDSHSTLKIDNGFGSSGTVMIVNGKININSNTNVYATDSDPKGYILMASTNTETDAIKLNSNVQDGICYALEGGITFESNAHATLVVAKRFHLNSNAVLDYDEGLIDASFTTGPGGGWTVKSGTWQEL